MSRTRFLHLAIFSCGCAMGTFAASGSDMAAAVGFGVGLIIGLIATK